MPKAIHFTSGQRLTRLLTHPPKTQGEEIGEKRIQGVDSPSQSGAFQTEKKKKKEETEKKW